MRGISVGTKVHAHVGGQLLPGVVVSHSFASTETYDLYWLRVAEYSEMTQRWQVSRSGPVLASNLTRRETHVPGLDLGEETRRRSQPIPEWVRQLHR
jgi:hypothetical protein